MKVEITKIWVTLLLFGILLACGSVTGRTSTDRPGVLESLGEPIPFHGIPSTNMWRAGNLLYGEAVDPTIDGNKGPFFVYDITTGEVIYAGNEDIHTGFRNIMVDHQGNAYFSVNTKGLAKYDPQTNNVNVLPVTLPGVLRASTHQSAAGWIYGATDKPRMLFRFRPTTNELENLGEAWGYTSHMVLDPTGQYIYYIPYAHGDSWRKGTPLLQYNVETNQHTVVAFLNNVYESKYGYRLGGTYALDIDAEGRRLFINMNAQEVGVDSTDGFGSPALLVIHLPANEAEHLPSPDIRFEDVTSQLGVAELLTGTYIHTASWGDVDNDGRLDLFTGTFVEREAVVPNKLLLNKGGSFVDADQQALEISGRSAGSVLADFDNDGDLDLYISNNRKQDRTGAAGEPSHILRNDTGVFVDVTSDSGLEAQSSNGRQVGILDYNNDGWLDLFIVADALVGSGPTVLMKNMGNFKFENATVPANIPTDINGLGLAIGDVTGNGWPDIFIAGGGVHDQNYLLLANGDGTYRRSSSNDQAFDWSVYVNGNEDWISGAAFGDLNRDGRLDLVIGHHFGSSAEQKIGAALRVYMNRGLSGGDPLFEDITSTAGLPNLISKSPHVEIQDFNNDGWPDIYTSVRVDTPDGLMPLIFTHNGLTGGDPTFSSPSYTNPHDYAGGPVADFNGDGKLDVFLSEWRTVLGEGVVPPLLMQNRGAPGNWLQIKVDHGANRMGVGAKVKVYRSGMSGNLAGLLGFTEISPAFGFSSSQPALAHFGLGTEQVVDVVVEMPFNGPVFTRNSVPANRLLVMPDGTIPPPPHQELSTTAVTDTSSRFLEAPKADLPAHTVAVTPPTVDFAVFPHPDHQGNSWSTWGGGLLASDGRFYSAIGDHLGQDGNAFVYVYDPLARQLTLIGDVLSTVNHVSGTWGHGKIHSQISEGPDGHIYMTSYWGSRKKLVFEGNYKGSVLLRYPLHSTTTGGNTEKGEP